MATRSPRFYRELFDRDRNFVVAKHMQVRGTKLRPGQPFDKTLLSIRRLRQFYDLRFLNMTPDAAVPVVLQRAAEPSIPNFDGMDKNQLRTWLIGQHIVPRPTATEASMRDRAMRKWIEDHPQLADSTVGAEEEEATAEKPQQEEAAGATAS